METLSYMQSSALQSTVVKTPVVINENTIRKHRLLENCLYLRKQEIINRRYLKFYLKENLDIVKKFQHSEDSMLKDKQDLTLNHIEMYLKSVRRYTKKRLTDESPRIQIICEHIESYLADIN